MEKFGANPILGPACEELDLCNLNETLELSELFALSGRAKSARAPEKGTGAHTQARAGAKMRPAR